MGPFRFHLLNLFAVLSYSVIAQSGLTVVDSIQVGGGFRSFRLYVPAAYDGNTSFPVLLNFHGLGSNGAQQQIYGNFMPIADTARFLILYPEGSKSGLSQFWNAGLIPLPNDVEFVDHLLDSIIARYNIDQDRIYSCGLSNGGIFSYYLACSGNRIAAVASVAGTMFRNWFYACAPVHARPVMEIHGTEDGTVPYEGNGAPGMNGLYMPVDTIIFKWVEHNKCSKEAVVTQLPDIDKTDFSTVTHYRYEDGADGAAVELYKVEGGSHSWPGSLPVFFHTNMDFNASAEIWRFFSAFRLSQFKTQVTIPEFTGPEQSFNIYPNPATDLLYFTGEPSTRISLYSTAGEVLVETDRSPIDLRDIPAGLYILQIEYGGRKSSRKLVRQ